MRITNRYWLPGNEDAEIGGNDGEQINDAEETCRVAQRTAHAQQAQQVFNSKQKSE